MTSHPEMPTQKIIDQFGHTDHEVVRLPAWFRDDATPWVHESGRETYRWGDRYTLWRRTKCRPVDMNDIQDNLRDLDQATHELVGEVAELAGIILDKGGACFVHGAARKQLIDEAGDVFFCAVWAGDAWEKPPLMTLPETDVSKILAPSDEFQWDMRRVALVRGFASGRYDPGLWEAVYAETVRGMVHAGLLANMFKKLRFQQRAQDRELASLHITRVAEWAARMAILADATVQDCLAANVRKLDHRYPDGYRVGTGGGNRTGVGS